MISKEQLEIIAREKCPKAAEILGLELKKVRYYKRRINEGHIQVLKIKQSPSKPHKWTTQEDKILMEKLNIDSIQEAVVVLKIPKKEVKRRCVLILQKQKAKLPILDILKKFPNMLPGQIQQMKYIYEYSPQSALKYCQAIQNYNDRYIPDEEQTNCF